MIREPRGMGHGKGVIREVFGLQPRWLRQASLIIFSSSASLFALVWVWGSSKVNFKCKGKNLNFFGINGGSGMAAGVSLWMFIFPPTALFLLLQLGLSTRILGSTEET